MREAHNSQTEPPNTASIRRRQQGFLVSASTTKIATRQQKITEGAFVWLLTLEQGRPCQQRKTQAAMNCKCVPGESLVPFQKRPGRKCDSNIQRHLIERRLSCRLEVLTQEVDPKGKRVVVVKLHIMADYSEDLLRSLHALAVEVLENDWHFYILLDVCHNLLFLFAHHACTNARPCWLLAALLLGWTCLTSPESKHAHTCQAIGLGQQHAFFAGWSFIDARGSIACIAKELACFLGRSPHLAWERNVVYRISENSAVFLWTCVHRT